MHRNMPQTVSVAVIIEGNIYLSIHFMAEFWNGLTAKQSKAQFAVFSFYLIL